MKRIVSFILVVVVAFGLCACSQSNSSGVVGNNSNTGSKKETPATIVDNEGNTAQKTVSELLEIAANQAKFEKLYRGASIKFTGKVKKVETSLSYNGGDFYDIIFFEEGWIVRLPEDIYGNGKYADVLAEINVGDSVTVESDICGFNTSLGEIDIRGMADNIGWDDESLLKTVIKVN